MDNEIIIKDDSGDKDFFTITPNYIINHSTAIDRALYLEMKRFAGEIGKCFATEQTMMKRLKIGKKAFDKALKYLLDKQWVSFVGLTEGKTRPIKTYKVNNIWQQNSEYYKKIHSKSNISFQNKKDKFQKQYKISAKSNVEEEPYNKKINKVDKSTLSSKKADNLSNNGDNTEFSGLTEEFIRDKLPTDFSDDSPSVSFAAKQKKGKNKTALSIIKKFENRVKKDFGANVVFGIVEYKSVQRALKKHNMTEPQIIEMCKDWFSSGRSDIEIISLRKCFSDHRINTYKYDRGL